MKEYQLYKYIEQIDQKLADKTRQITINKPVFVQNLQLENLLKFTPVVIHKLNFDKLLNIMQDNQTIGEIEQLSINLKDQIKNYWKNFDEIQATLEYYIIESQRIIHQKEFMDSYFSQLNSYLSDSITKQQANQLVQQDVQKYQKQIAALQKEIQHNQSVISEYEGIDGEQDYQVVLLNDLETLIKTRDALQNVK
ncbi:hypothetical protein SS50377_26765 [Spironucleus salmonicida]|uniref:Uncharacterized protein n=1 Tax=Spironucleus salmonicida TaxID=348837 RepID=V6M738_9EUKA|nr:hypothetical protein SS50377_26765 [Spironucleus salmonicida]|eukprot:EST49234.1 Hypothetical protein SS50377_10454 [Spironucleus salmonicida]